MAFDERKKAYIIDQIDMNGARRSAKPTNTTSTTFARKSSTKSHALK